MQELPLLIPPHAKVLAVTGNHCRKLAGELLPGAVFAPPVQAELPLEDAQKVLDAGRVAGADAVVAIGGGSVMDAGKTAAALLPLEGSVKEYFYGKKSVPGKGVWFAACPTTAGTGAEMTSNAVLCDRETGIKQSLRHPSMTADLVLADPCLTYGSPAAVTASSGFDALVQAAEASISRKANTVTLALSLVAATQIFENIAKAVKDDRQARIRVAEASMMTGMAFAQSGLGAVHGIAHPLGSLCHVPHGIACAVLFTAVMKRNMPCASVLEGMFGSDPLARFAELRRECGIPDNFRQYGLKESHFSFIVRHCRSGSMKCNPVELQDEDVTDILKEVL